MSWLDCPYLDGEVEMTDERESHVAERHPDLLPEFRDHLAQTLTDLDQVRRSARFGDALLFSRWFPDVRGGKHVVVSSEKEAVRRHWLVTAYIARKLAEGQIEWKRS